ncbi:malic enzyme-like NAD(P)-binding protein [Kurthia sp. FSL E2-0154]|uniref:malic enzyme-like NAD(P)-binding protein n=2 Tax=Kurthia sp. FSL E2-0154 TaxID=2921358 RepID=UPI0030F7AC60
MFIGVSVANVLTEAMIQSMNQDPIVFALANPNLEITYEHAMEWGVRVIATGRSDYPNQVNNMLAFLGIFKGALAVQATDINDEMKMAAVKAVSELVTAEQIERGMVIPNVFETDVTNDVAQAAIDSKVAQKIPSLI